MKSRRSVFFSTIVAALGGLLFGFDTAVISGTIEALQEVFDLDEFWLGFTVAIALIGTIVGAFSAGKPGDLFGRKRVLFILRRGATLRRRLGLALDVRGRGFSGGAVLRVAFLDSFQPALAGEERTRRGGPRGTGAVGRTRPRPGNGRDHGLASGRDADGAAVPAPVRLPHLPGVGRGYVQPALGHQRVDVLCAEDLPDGRGGSRRRPAASRRHRRDQPDLHHRGVVHHRPVRAAAVDARRLDRDGGEPGAGGRGLLRWRGNGRPGTAGPARLHRLLCLLTGRGDLGLYLRDLSQPCDYRINLSKSISGAPI